MSDGTESAGSIQRVVPRALRLSDAAESVKQFARRFDADRHRLLSALRSTPALVQLARSLGAAKTYVIEWPPEALGALRAGKAVWEKAVDGSLPAVVRLKDNSEIVKHLRLREVSGSSTQGLNALNNLALQSAIASVVEQLEDLDAKLDSVLAGARADRLGYVIAGEQMYGQALAARDPENRHRALHSALQTLATGRGQLMASITSEARLLRPATGNARPFAKAPSEKLADSYRVLEEDARSAALATRSMILVHEELGEPDMAREALGQFAHGLAEPARRLRELAPHVPYSRTFDPQRTWAVLEDRVLPAARASASALEGAPKPLLTEFTPGEILAEPKDGSDG